MRILTKDDVSNSSSPTYNSPSGTTSPRGIPPLRKIHTAAAAAVVEVLCVGGGGVITVCTVFILFILLRELPWTAVGRER